MGHLSVRRWLVVAVAAVASLAATAISAAALAATSGNSKSLSLYRRAQQAVGQYQGVTFTGAGTSYKLVRYPTYDSFDFYFGAVLRGYRRATDHVRVVQRHGIVTEEVDTLSARGLPAVRLVQDRPGTIAFGLVLSHRGCAVVFSDFTQSWAQVGAPFTLATNSNVFAAPKRANGHWLIPSSFPLAGGTGHQTDTISASSYRWSSVRLKVAGGFYHGEGLSGSSFKYLAHEASVAPPQLGRC
jgi:hypothetical protein